MNVRIFMPIAVFVAGFGLGYGLTWLLVGPDSASAVSRAPSISPTVVASGPTELDEAPEAPAAEGDEGEADEGEADEAEADEAEADEAEADEAEADEPDEADEAEADEAEADEPDDADEPEADEPEVDEPEADEPDDADEPEADLPDGDDDDAEPSGVRWWEACKGVTCQVDWGGIEGGMSIREGSVTHGETVSWEPTYAAAQRLLIVPTEGRNQNVTLMAVGMGPDGLPSVAHLRLSSDGQDVTGVLKLEVNGKRISLRPATRP